jgi:hypothetical protein
MRPNNTPAHKAALSVEVAVHLARGRPVVGVAAHRDALPSVLRRAADVTLTMGTLDGATLGRAIQMFTGTRAPTGIDDKLALGLDFNDLVSAFRKNSSAADIVDRLRKAGAALRGGGSAERLPDLETAIEYGAARVWGLALARDITDFKAGKRAGIVVVGLTNNIAGVDAAILRPGRLKRAIEVTRPDHAGILNVLRHHLDDSLNDADLTEVGHLLAGSTPADVMMVVRGARRIARYAGHELELDDLLQSIAPLEQIPANALMRISAHEAGHAVGSLAVPAGTLERCVIAAPRDRWAAHLSGTRPTIWQRAIPSNAGPSSRCAEEPPRLFLSAPSRSAAAATLTATWPS